MVRSGSPFLWTLALGFSEAVPTPSHIGSDQVTINGILASTRQVEKLQCALPEPRGPANSDDHRTSSTFWNNETFGQQVERLSAVVAIPTISYDDIGDVWNDTRWASFNDLHQVLENLFPVTHNRAELVKVNRFGLIYTIHGSVQSQRPILLTAHQDVVPVQSDTTWTHPPFEPYFDGQFLWGRGACDCKNNLIGILSAVEELLSHDDWIPKRTIILAFGFDEEIGGSHGAAHIAAELEKAWGPNSIEWILDEGGMGLVLKGDTLYALPAVHEKSYLDVYIDLEIDGGHSSRPPPHSGIGIMSEMVIALEEHPYTPMLIEDSPTYQHLVCQAIYSPDSDPWLRDALETGDLEYIAKKFAAQSVENRFRIQTSQAVDIINGGGKINALPEQITLGVNYRIAPQDSIEVVRENIIEHIRPIISKFGLSLNRSGSDERDVIHEGPTDAYDPVSRLVLNGTVHVRLGGSTPKAPISPTQANPVWNEFSATVQHVFSQYATRVVPVGDMKLGNTDTRHYWPLSENIYRWSPSRFGTRVNVHTVDERLDMAAHIDGLRLYYDLIRNFDIWNGE